MNNPEQFWQREIQEISPDRIQSARKDDGVERYDAVYEPETFEWGDGKRMDFLGVSHVPETLEAYREAIKEKILSSDEVLLENAFFARGILSEQGIQELMDVATAAGVQVETGRVLEIFFELPSVKFFRDVEVMVQAAGKDLIVADPLAGSTVSALKAQLENKEYDLLKERLLKMAFFASGVSAGAVLVSALSILDKINASQRISRRDFLKTLGGGAAFAGAALSAGLFSRSASIGDSPISDRVRDGAEVFSLRDYRDVVAATAADTALSQGRESGGRLTAIYGNLHLLPVKYYLEHSEERMMRMAAYGRFREAIPPMADVYAPDPSVESGWRKKESINLYE
jgi:hypothetical protein